MLLLVTATVPVAVEAGQLLHLFNFTYVQKYASGELDFYKNYTVNLGTGSTVISNLTSMIRVKFTYSNSEYNIEIPEINDSAVTFFLGTQNLTLKEDSMVSLDLDNKGDAEINLEVTKISQNRAQINISEYTLPSTGTIPVELLGAAGIGLAAYLILFSRRK
jgi:LPXTG-motif cell wall-anchored protein